GADGALLEAPAVSFDGRRVAVILRKQGKRTLYTLSADGGDIRPLSETIDVASSAGWAPDGRWIAAAGSDNEGPGLFKIPVDGGTPVRLLKGLAANPVWSPDGTMIVYTGPVVGVLGPLSIVTAEGTPVNIPFITVRTGGERYRFVPGTRELVYLAGDLRKQTFNLLDLTAGRSRILSDLDHRYTRTFDVTPDGRQIVFDRLR